MTHTTWAPVRAADLGRATGNGDGFADTFPTQPIAAGPAAPALDDRPTRPPRSVIRIAVAVVIALVVGALGYHAWAPSSSAATHTPATSPPTVARQAEGVAPPPPPPGSDVPHRGRIGAVGEADGVVPAGVTIFDNDYPAVAKLNPALLKALRRAARSAARGGVEFYVNSGWRSPRYQDQLLRDAISTYGSAQEAARWVATVATSPHVSGNAIDIGRSDAAAWLSQHGATYGLCQIYRNEPWHYELRPAAVDRGCPALYADPTHDPRMQK